MSIIDYYRNIKRNYIYRRMSSSLPENSNGSIKSETKLESETGSSELCQLMENSFVQKKSQSLQFQLPEESHISSNSSKEPSILKNLEEAEYRPQTRLSQLIHTFNHDLYQQQIKTLKTLGIIPQQKTELQLRSSNYLSKKHIIQDDDISTKMETPQPSRAVQRTICGDISNFPTQCQSFVGENAVVFKLKSTCSAEKGFSLFKNYLLKNKLEVVNDSYNMIMTKLKIKGSGFSVFIDSFKSIDRMAEGLHLCLSFVEAPRLLKLSLTGHPKYLSSFSKHGQELINHGSTFQQYLWENNCIDVSEKDLIDLTLKKQKESIVELKAVIKNTIKTNKTQSGLEKCLLKVLQLRDLLMFQIEQKNVLFTKYNPLLEIQKALLQQMDLYSIYKEMYAKQEQRYQQRKKHIKTKYSRSEIYSYLKIPESDRLIQEDGDFPYELALEQLNKFVSDPYPHLFLQRVQWIYNNFLLCRQNKTGRTSISKQFQQQNNLQLIILCLLQSDLTGVYSKIKFLEDYLKLVDNSKYQKMCLNLAIGVDYIENSWYVQN